MNAYYCNIEQSLGDSPFIPYSLAETSLWNSQKWSRNTQKRLYFDLKIAIFFQRLGASPPNPPSSGSWGFCSQTPASGYPNFSNLNSSFWNSCVVRTLLVRTLR